MPSEFLKRLRQRNVLGGPVDSRRVRMVTHLDIDRSDIEQAVRAIHAVLGQGF